MPPESAPAETADCGGPVMGWGGAPALLTASLLAVRGVPALSGGHVYTHALPISRLCLYGDEIWELLKLIAGMAIR